ncbi:MAG TPA: hypothetical protein DDW33_04480 [Ktedonobacter sp.]|jgi:uncharacterized Zn finger protein|nr:hypothetical protein [Ktedonobacter sp.]HAG98071.1 hypothetical protein [Ktedonobacter sp.]HBE24927.1 hypothetical protein [Ktedonobacter sp.]HCJ35698.1 hypothetical protein [Ktedonobacter sp.]HCP75239.1 hypothetical protein [Ktedonobacter sp.]
MGRWRDRGYKGYKGYGDDWDYYEPSPPKRVEGGIKTRSEWGEIGETWWSKRWIKVLESFSMGTRLTRGRSYARQGQVISIDVEAGIVKAEVQGSQAKPYNVKIRLEPLSDQDWEKVTEAMASQALFAAKLLAGEMPQNIEEAFASVNVSLFPTALKELNTECSCPDWANPCKHIAAVYYLLAERFDEDPFLIFKLRGRTKEQIIEVLRGKRAEALPGEHTLSTADAGSSDKEEELLSLEEHRETFWQAGEALESFTVNLTTPKIDKAILKRLGNAPFSIGDTNVTFLLAKAYDMVDVAVSKKLAEGE